MLITTQGVFMFNEELYQYTDGVIMGNPLDPTSVLGNKLAQ